MHKQLLIVCAIFVFAVLAQETVPDVAGRYDDQECNLIPESKELYQRRTITYGAWNNEEQYGSWSYLQTVYRDKDCDPNLINYVLSYSGNYSLTGKESDFLDNFWHITYRLSSKVIEIENAAFANSVAEDPSCSLSVAVNVGQNIRHTNCPLLQILPIEKCPAFFDVVRLENSRLWIGQQFIGDPIYWQPNCDKDDRPTTYDPYSLRLTGAAAPTNVTVNLDDFYTGTLATSEFDPNSRHLGLGSSYYGIEEVSSSSVIVPVTIAFSVIVLLM